jgi:AcrR family transcriptional regulator
VSRDDQDSAQNGTEAPSWREQAVARSLDSARTRAESRVQRFLDAALELMAEGDRKDFTVQEVVERSGQSLRSFYQYFGGKHELLLGLFEESVRTTTEQLAKRIDTKGGDDPLDRLHIFVVEYYKMCQPPRKGKGREALPSPILVRFALQLLTAHPAESSRAFVPLVSLFDELLLAAVDAGAIRADLNRQAVTGPVLQVIMFNTFSSAIVDGADDLAVRDAAEALWDVLVNGLSA